MADFQCAMTHGVPSLSTKNNFTSLKVADSSLRSSNHWGGGGGYSFSLRPKLSKSSMCVETNMTVSENN